MHMTTIDIEKYTSPTEKSVKMLWIVTISSWLVLLWIVIRGYGGVIQFSSDVVGIISRTLAGQAQLDEISILLLMLSVGFLVFVPLIVFYAKPSRRKIVFFVILGVQLLVLLLSYIYANICTGKLCDLIWYVSMVFSGAILLVYAYLHALGVALYKNKYYLAYIWLGLLCVAIGFIEWAN